MNINSDTALMRGVRTAVQSMVGLIVGLFVTVWAVPGVPDAVLEYIYKNALPLIVGLGVPSGVAGYIWNLLREDVKNY